MIGAVEKGGVGTETHTGRTPRKMRVLHLQGKEHQIFPANHQEPGKRPGADPFSIVLRGNQPWRHFGLGLAAS